MLAWAGQYLRKAPIREIPAQEVRQRMHDGTFTLLDANLWGQWVRGHIPGATWVGLEEYDPALLPGDKNRMLVFYCESSL